MRDQLGWRKCRFWFSVRRFLRDVPRATVRIDKSLRIDIFLNPPKPILDHIFRNSFYGFEAWFVESEKSRYARTKSMVLVWNSFSREQLGNCGQNSRKSVTLNYVKAVSKIDFLKNVDSQRSARRIFKFQTTKRLRTLNRTLHLRRPYDSAKSLKSVF